MSLYDGLDIDDNESSSKDNKPDVSGWGSRMKLIETQKQLQAKKASLLNLKKRQGTSVAPVFDLKKRTEENPLHFNLITGKLEKRKGAISPAEGTTSSGTPPPIATPFIGSEAPVATSFLLVKDEYDPTRPNEYEDIMKTRREQRQKEREEEKKREDDGHEQPKDRRRREKGHRRRGGNSSDEGSDEEDGRRSRKRRGRDNDEDESKAQMPRMGGAAIAPPPSLIEETKPRDDMDEQGPLFPRKPEAGKIGHALGLGGSVVSKMMAKMGYREGQGLGKSEQGMSTALQVEKTSKRGGKIIHEKDLPKVPEAPRAEVSNANILKNPSKVILLRNMVGPGEVDEELEPETAEECSKYGKVIKCLIFEIPGAVPEEAVRIFLEFERQEAAIKAVVDLNGRFFGGRIVKAGFYNLDRFRRLDLADPMAD